MSNESEKNGSLGQKESEMIPKDCPFCGSVAAVHMSKETVHGKAKVEYYIRCHDTQGDCPCSPSTAYSGAKTEKRAIESWNRREVIVS